MEFIDGKDYTLARRADEATGSLKGTTKRGDVKSSQGEKARADCVSEGERWHNLWHHTVYLVAVTRELGAHGGRANVRSF